MPTTLRRSTILVIATLWWSTQCIDAQSYTWNWGRALASADKEEVTGVATFGSSGAIYSCGYTEGNGFITGTLGSVLGNNDAFLIKQNAAGVREWAFTPSGIGESQATDIALDAAGNIYVTGWFKGTIDLHGMSGIGSGTVISSGDEDWFIASYTPAGALRWRAKLGGSGNDIPTGISVNTDRVVVLGAINGRITTTFGTVSSALPTGKDNLVLAAYELNGTGQWLLSGGSGDDELPSAVTTDDDRIYTSFRAKNASFRWYGPTGTTLATSTTPTDKQVRISSFSNSGAHQWTTSLTESNDGNYGMNALRAGCDALYITGITHDPCTFPGVGTVTTGTHDLLYLGRINTANGHFQWVTTGTSTGSHHTTGGTGIAIGKGGAVHLTGNFKDDITIGSTTMVSTTGKVQPFVASFRPTGLLARIDELTSSKDASARAIDADASGNIVLAGTFETDLTCGTISITGHSNENGYLFKGQLAGVGGSDPSFWSPPAPMCSDASPVDLSSLLTPAASGGATAVTNSSNVTNPNSALGIVMGFYASFNTTGGYVTVDLGTVVPSGTNISILWRSQGGSAVANISSGNTASPPGNSNGTVSTNSTNAVYSNIVLSSEARYVRITRPFAGSVGFDVDGVYYAYGNTMSGTWSGTGVSGSTFNPIGLSGPIDVTYSVGSGSCLTATTNTIQVTAAPDAGINGTLAICSGSPPVALFGYLGGSPQYGGTWSGPSPVTAGMYDPATMAPGSYVYTVPGTGLCSGSASASAAVTVGATPSGGTFSGAGTVCPSPASGTLSISGYSGSIVRWAASTDGGGSWSQVGTNTNSITWSNLTGPTLYKVELSQPGCGTGFSPTVTLTPEDNAAPTLNCPASEPIETAYANGSCRIQVPSFLSYYTASDNCTSPPLIQQTPAAGSMIPFSTSTTVTISAVDASGATSSTCTATLLGVDTIAPTFTCPASVSLVVGANSCSVDHTVVPIAYADNCWGNGIAEKTYIRSGSQVTTPLATFDPSGWSEITASLDRTLTPGMYTVVFVHENGVEDIALCSYRIEVDDNQPPTVACGASVTINNTPGACSGTMPDLLSTVGTSDNCGILSVTQDPAAGSTVVGSFLVTYTVTDVNGLTTACQQSATVRDTEVPTLSCPPNMTVASAIGSCGAIVAYSMPVVSENCTGSTLIRISGPESGSFFPVGSTNITYRVIDANSHSAECTFTISVEDLDSDLDGTTDCADGCPGDPNKTTPGICGCGVAD
ncbi:MAG: HYR domain-containing protein, partial [Flavobacteriales bacterium]|nr:HYR domain-containing protein [Flavobacteriales bacterium]